MNPRDHASLLDIAKAARLTIGFVVDMGQPDFEAHIPLVPKVENN